MYKFPRFFLIITLLTTLAACGGSGSSGSLPALSVAAGGDQEVFLGDAVNLTATVNRTQAMIQSIQWTQTAGTSVPLANTDTTLASFSVPDLGASETLTFEVTVTDTGGESATDSVDVTITPLYQGTFVYGPTEGLTYTTATQSGTTDADGHYYYKFGETIQFSVGDMLVGDEVAAAQELPLHELFKSFELFTNNTDFYRWDDWIVFSSNSKTAFYRFKNTLSFLQTLDEDANPDNGLTIAVNPHHFNGHAISSIKEVKHGTDHKKKLRSIYT